MRRWVVTGLALALATGTACKKEPAGARVPLRLGLFPNLTHAQALVGNGEGLFAREVGGPVTVRQFNAGPAAMEALLAGDVDVAYVGPGPAVIAYLRSGGAALRLVAGSASGGAVLVTREARSPRELLGKRVASPQLGNTQDIALRVWLRHQGLRIGEGAGAVRVMPISNPDIMGLFARGELAAAWVPEPWGARLVAEAGAHILVDERDLWPDRQFPTTVVVASRRALEGRRQDVVAFLRAHLALTTRWKADPAAFARAANAEYGKLTGHPLPDRVLQDAFSRLEPNAEPLVQQLMRGAKDAQELQFAPPGDLTGLVDRGPLEEARRTASR
jgi:NitT/TauT family transport system substrate-binding protein